MLTVTIKKKKKTVLHTCMLLSHTTFVKWMSRNKNSERAKEAAAKTPPQRNTLCSSSSMSKREKKNKKRLHKGDSGIGTDTHTQAH